MRKLTKIAAAMGVATLFAGAAIPAAHAEDPLPTDKQCSENPPSDALTQGWCAAIIRSKGNCLACHDMQTPRFPKDLPASGNIAPPLVVMKARFPDREKLRAQIWDATVANPHTIMIPFGKNGVLSEKEIDNIVDFLYTL